MDCSVEALFGKRKNRRALKSDTILLEAHNIYTCLYSR